MVDERPDMPVANDMTAHRRLIRAGNTARAVLFIVVLTTLVVYGLSHMTLLVFPILVAFILAAAISPFVGWLKRRDARNHRGDSGTMGSAQRSSHTTS